MKRRIVELSMRGESPNDIAIEVGTTPQYVYNARMEARKRGITFPTTTTNDERQTGPVKENVQVPPQGQDVIKERAF